MDAPKDDLYRGVPGGLTLATRDGEDGDGEEGGSGTAAADATVMTGHFCVFNEWTEISSWYEGEFLERVAPGATKRTINNDRANVKVQYDHGCDDWVGSGVLGVIDELAEDDIGTFYAVPLLDTDYNRDRVLPMLQGRLMSGELRGSVRGASFRFRVTRDEWVHEPKPSTYNPTGLPERTIREIKLYEFGPVVFPAYPAATASAGRMVGLTDHYLERRRERRTSLRSAAPTPVVASAISTGAPASSGLSVPQHHDTPLRFRQRLEAFR